MNNLKPCLAFRRLYDGPCNPLTAQEGRSVSMYTNDLYDKDGETISLEKDILQSGNWREYPYRMAKIFLALKVRRHVPSQLFQIEWKTTLRDGIISIARADSQFIHKIMPEIITQPVKSVLPEVQKTACTSASKS
jgi:hypothetical protein